MRKIIRIKSSELQSIINNYSLKFGIAPYVIEKDLWNCYFLDFLFNRSKYKDYFIFKGGTSLSKCYDLVNRYSEDLDVVLDSNIFNINLEEKIKNLPSRNQREKFIEYINDMAMDFIENKLIPEMKEECNNETDKKLYFTLQRDELAFYVTYPNISNDDYVRPRIKIEMSSLSAIIPTEEKKIEPYLNIVLPDEYKSSFNVKCMLPKRTFWEKALILHQEANRTSGNILPRYSRHYYDLYKIYNSKYWNETLHDLKLLDEVRTFTITFYNRSWAKFEEAKVGSFKLCPPDAYINDLAIDYEQMGQMIFGTPPKFSEILDTIKKIEKEINEL